MNWYTIILVFLVLLGAFTLSYQIFKLIELDAKSRGLKHPKLWGGSLLVVVMVVVGFCFI